VISAMLAFAIALMVVTTLTPVVRWAAVGMGAVDAPGRRRVHVTIIPRLGGVAIAIAFYVPLLAIFGGETEVARMFFAEPRRIVGLALGGLVLCGTGIVDDIRGMRAWYKLALQLVAAAIAYACDYRIDAIALPYVGHLDMGVFSFPVTALWIVAIVNAINLIDGLDGLASGITFFVCVVNFVVGALHRDPLVMMLSASLGGAVLGFLLYNWNPASIFMGDSGSLFIGYVLATTAIQGAAIKSSTTIAILVPLIALGLPIIDTLFAMVRRFVERRPIFSPDRGHIHHRLLAMGLNHRRAVLILYGLTILFTSGAILMAMGRDWQVGGAIFVLSVAVIGVVRATGNLSTAIQQWRRREQRPRAEEVERLRRQVPIVLTRIATCREIEDLHGVLRDFAAGAGLDALELLALELPALEGMAWSRPPEAGPTPSDAPPLVSSSYTLPSAGKTAALRFVWSADRATVAPEAEILLQLVADACEERLGRGQEARAALASGRLRKV
jgi:UDP-GlcNAc:undecaprenyl-phosphate GlcNAc-1-phosphate transferase